MMGDLKPDKMPDLGAALQLRQLRLEWVEDLIWHDFALLSHLVGRGNSSDQNYLRLWIDCDGRAIDPRRDRYLTFRVAHRELLMYRNGSISLREVLLKTPDEFVYVEDFVRGEPSCLRLLRLEDVPQAIMPADDSYFVAVDDDAENATRATGG